MTFCRQTLNLKGFILRFERSRIERAQLVGVCAGCLTSLLFIVGDMTEIAPRKTLFGFCADFKMRYNALNTGSCL